MKNYERIFVIVLDSLGIGAMPDSAKFGDIGVDTFGHILEKMGSLEIPNLRKLGMLNLHPAGKMAGVENPKGRYMRLSEASNGKDTMTGHWEMMGIKTEKPFKTFTETGFPPELIAELEKRCGKRVIGNKSASGTEIIEELGEEEIQTGAMIVYTSADSVLQICGNEETFDLQNLYRCCEIAREITMKDEWRVGRVIARPFVGSPGNFTRTTNRHDFSIEPPKKTILDVLNAKGFDVLSVGKIVDIFTGRGITKFVRTTGNADGIDKTLEYMDEDFCGLCFTNLVDFDMLYGHRNNVDGYAAALSYFDDRLPEILDKMRDDDLLMITADHGCDPGTASTDHSREYIPLVMYGKNIKADINYHTRETFADIGATVLSYFGISDTDISGTSIL